MTVGSYVRYNSNVCRIEEVQGNDVIITQFRSKSNGGDLELKVKINEIEIIPKCKGVCESRYTVNGMECISCGKKYY